MATSLNDTVVVDKLQRKQTEKFHISIIITKCSHLQQGLIVQCLHKHIYLTATYREYFHEENILAY